MATRAHNRSKDSMRVGQNHAQRDRHSNTTKRPVNIDRPLVTTKSIQIVHAYVQIAGAVGNIAHGQEVDTSFGDDDGGVGIEAT